MNILISLKTEWCQKILNREKPFEFRSVLPKNLALNDKIYFYETKAHGGSGKILGYATLEDIWTLKDVNYGYPVYGAYHFIDWWLEHINSTPVLAKHFRDVKKEFYGNMPNYKFGCIIDYAMSPEELDSLRKTGRLVDTFKIFPNEKAWKICNDNEVSRKLIYQCDEWLEKIGFYNDTEESKWKYAFLLKNIVKFDKPLNLTDFVDRKGNLITKAPQSWMYC